MSPFSNRTSQFLLIQTWTAAEKQKLPAPEGFSSETGLSTTTIALDVRWNSGRTTSCFLMSNLLPSCQLSQQQRPKHHDSVSLRLCIDRITTLCEKILHPVSLQRHHYVMWYFSITVITVLCLQPWGDTSQTQTIIYCPAWVHPYQCHRLYCFN